MTQGNIHFISFWHGRCTWDGFLLWESIRWQIWPLGPCQISLRARWRRAARLVLVTLRLVLPDGWITQKSSQSLPLALFRVKSKRLCVSLPVFSDASSLRIIWNVYVCSPGNLLRGFLSCHGMVNTSVTTFLINGSPINRHFCWEWFIHTLEHSHRQFC